MVGSEGGSLPGTGATPTWYAGGTVPREYTDYLGSTYQYAIFCT